MNYSNNIPKWDGTEVLAGNQVGWMGQVWTALSTTTTEPKIDNAVWRLDKLVQLTGFGIAEIPNPKDYLHIHFTGFGIEEEHTNRPPEVKLFGFGFEQHRNQPYLISSIN